ncbi:redoxin domain-containing protein [Flavisolibacter sp. BT320]|nr:redoxin domain-containing protein [Flavisolibacter longurius]
MKKFLTRCILVLALTSVVPGVQAQETLPNFNLQLSSGRYFTQADLAKDKPVVLIYFAPDCDHCRTLLDAFFQRANDFQSATVLLVTFKPLAEVTAFERAYSISKYPHVRVGTEGLAQSLRRFYKLQRTPFTALYNREGKLVASYRNETPLDVLLQQVKKL